jgi:hypothetical protein
MAAKGVKRHSMVLVNGGGFSASAASIQRLGCRSLIIDQKAAGIAADRAIRPQGKCR